MSEQGSMKSTIWQERLEVPVHDCLAEIQDEWEEISSQRRFQSPFMSFSFTCLWYECFAKQYPVRFIRVQDKGETLGFLPLFASKDFGLRKLNSLTNAHCLHFSPLVRTNDYKNFFSKAAQFLGKDRSSWDILSLDWIHSFDEMSAVVNSPELIEGPLKWHLASEPNFTIDLTCSFDEFFATRSSQLRTNLRRHSKQLTEAGEWQMVHLRGEDALAQFGEFVEIEDSGWKSEAGSSIAKTPANFQNYYRGLIQLLADQDLLHLYFLELNGQKIAAVFGYTEGDLFHYTKIGYREEYQKLSPSNLLLLEILREIKETMPAIKRFHLFPVGGRYKHRWANEESETYSLTFYSNSIRGNIAYFVASVRKSLKNISWLRRAITLLRKMAKG